MIFPIPRRHSSSVIAREEMISLEKYAGTHGSLGSVKARGRNKSAKPRLKSMPRGRSARTEREKKERERERKERSTSEREERGKEGSERGTEGGKGAENERAGGRIRVGGGRCGREGFLRLADRGYWKKARRERRSWKTIPGSFVPRTGRPPFVLMSRRDPAAPPNFRSGNHIFHSNLRIAANG